MTTRDAAIGRNLREVREGLGMSQADLATALSDAGVAGIYPQTIAKIEMGRRALKYAEGIHIANQLGIEGHELLDAEHFSSDDLEARRRARVLQEHATRVGRTFFELQQAYAKLDDWIGDASRELSESARADVERLLSQWRPAVMAQRLVDDTAELGERA